MRERVGDYSTVIFMKEAAIDTEEEKGSFSVAPSSDTVVTGKRLRLAFGISDILPEKPAWRNVGIVGDQLPLLPWL